MIKFSETSSYDFGISPTALIQDMKRMEKRASQITEHLKKLEKNANQENLHIIAVGAYEGTGYNRNMDRFRQYWCEKNAHYFKDADRAVNRHHKNKPEDPKYGNIKVAYYNPAMRRIELVVGLDKHACQDILHEQEKVGHTNWSMASKQAYDVCTWCEKKSASDDERCEHIPGQLGELNKVGEMCGMDNPDPKWFEISYVKRPADRIGMSLQKTASAVTHLLPRDYLNIYTGFQVPDEGLTISKYAADKRDLLLKLSALEKRLAAVSTDKKMLALSHTEKLAFEDLQKLREMQPAEFFKTAANNGILLSPENFFNYVFNGKVKEASVNAVKVRLPRIFEDLTKNASAVVNDETYDTYLHAPIVKQSNFIEKLASSFSLDYDQALLRIPLGFKLASTGTDEGTQVEEELAKQYGMYKLSTLNYLQSTNKLNDSFLAIAVMQNRV